MSSAPPELPLQDLEEILAEAEGIFEALRDARIFMTGGTGFFGRWLVESLLHADQRLDLSVRISLLTRNRAEAIDRWPAIAADSRVEVYEGDVRNFEYPPGEHSHILHAAADTIIGRSPSESRRRFDTIVEGTRRVLDFRERCGATRVLFTSSGAVYGRQPPDLTHIPEEYTGPPESPDLDSSYRSAKCAAEALCRGRTGTSGTEISIARCFAFVGPNLPLDAHFAIGNFISDALQGGHLHVRSDGTSVRSYMYAGDLAVWLWTILVRGTGGRAYNVGSDKAISIREVAEAVAEQGAHSLGVKVAHQVGQGPPPTRYVPSIERARAELGLEVRVDLEEAVRRTMEWYREEWDEEVYPR